MDLFSMTLRSLEGKNWKLDISKDLNLLLSIPEVSKQCIELHLDASDKAVIFELAVLLLEKK